MTSNDSAGGRLVATDEARLPLVAAELRVEARGGLARVVCQQRFVNRHAEPLHVLYSLPLPPDAAVSGFSFRVGERRIAGEIDRRASARERFEAAIAEGHSAALLDQERSSLFTQEIGNIPPGAEVVAEVTLDQRLIWTDGGEWEWRFPTTVLPRYLGQPGRVPDAPQVSQAIAGAALPVRLTLAMTVRDALGGKRPHSSAHALHAREEAGAMRVALAAEGGVPLDRDLVVCWHGARREVGVELERSRARAGAPRSGSAFGLLTLVPPEGAPEKVSRDVIVLLDTSGSMSGRPLEQAARVVSALLDTLDADDSLEMIEFSTRARRFEREPLRVTAEARAKARAWLAALQARGSTEMRAAIEEGLRGLRPDAQRQVVLVTDGAIGFESEVIAALCRDLPADSRLHTVGVGSAVNRSLTAPAARAGRGVEIVLGLDDDPERAAVRLLRGSSVPVLVDLELGGSALVRRAPSRLPDVFAGAPLLVALELSPEGGELDVSGKLPGGRRWHQRVRVAPTEPGSGSPALGALFARESVEDLELELAAGAQAAAIDARIESLGLDFQISTRLTSWVAVSEQADVDPTKPVRRVRMPHELPHGTSVEGLGLRSSLVGAVAAAAPMTLGVRRLRSLGAEATLGFGGLAGEGGPGAPPPSRGGGLFAGAVERFQSLVPGLGGSDDANGELADGHLESDDELEDGEVIELEGAVLVSRAREIVISVTIATRVFEWAPGERAEIEWAGQKLEAKVVTARSTRAGTVTVGQAVRVWLELGVELPPGKPRRVWLSGGSRRVAIRIDA